VKADKDTNVEVVGDAGTGPDAGGAAKPRRRTRSVVVKQLASSAAVAVSAVKNAEKKKMENEGYFPIGDRDAGNSDASLKEGRVKRRGGGRSHRRTTGRRRPTDKEAEKPRCQEAVGVGREYIIGCPSSRFGDAANCCCSAGKDACDV
jgi:hypothetical protein